MAWTSNSRPSRWSVELQFRPLGASRSVDFHSFTFIWPLLDHARRIDLIERYHLSSNVWHPFLQESPHSCIPWSSLCQVRYQDASTSHRPSLFLRSCHCILHTKLYLVADLQLEPASSCLFMATVIIISRYLEDHDCSLPKAGLAATTLSSCLLFWHFSTLCSTRKAILSSTLALDEVLISRQNVVIKAGR